MDGILLDLRQKRPRPEQESLNKEHVCTTTSLKVALSECQTASHLPYGVSESQKMFLKCQDCGKSFSHSSSLKRHSRTHSGVRPFICSICSKSFHYKNNLQDHARTHTGEKPFKCPDCGQSFAQSSTLNRHIGTHGKDKTCHICGMVFVKLSLLQKHFSIHVEKEKCIQSSQFYEKGRVSSGEVNSKDSCSLTVKLDVEEIEAPNEHTLLCSKCGLKFKEVLELQQHHWCHVGEGQTLFYEIAALNGFFNMYEVLKQNVSQSRG